MRVRYTPRAFADREAIFDYLQKRSPQGAWNVKRAIVHAIRLPRRPYKVYYRIEGEDIWIIHIRDARRRPWEGE